MLHATRRSCSNLIMAMSTACISSHTQPVQLLQRCIDPSQTSPTQEQQIQLLSETLGGCGLSFADSRPPLVAGLLHKLPTAKHRSKESCHNIVRKIVWSLS